MKGLLDTLAQYRGTDKCSTIHNYCEKYQKYLPFNRYDNINLLEIGVLDGKSLLTWKDWFYQSNILGIDINPDCKQYENKDCRISVEIGSQVDENFLDKVTNEYGPFDMILDDGSHINEHVIYTFNKLFPFVKSQGVYIIEDRSEEHTSELQSH